ncbi:MAG: hypothetical protein K2X82_01185, partial [Gemmataceae bacterium]|nr:hypothetical protein [Gemmataceae bacterium]
ASCHRAGVGVADPPAVAAAAGTPVADDWPADAKPLAVIVLSGETFGYVQPCGCSSPQKGGLERRANFVAGLKAQGIPVVGADLGDLYPDRHPVGPPGLLTPPAQALLKYTTSLHALRDMGYVAVGAGKTEFAGGLPRLVAGYAQQKERPPYTLAGNVIGLSDKRQVPREAYFPPADGGTRPTVGLAEIADAGGVSVGVVGIVGKDVSEIGRKADPLLEFLMTPDTLKDAAAALPDRAKKPAVNVLLFQGPLDHARAVAKDRPEFDVILCRADDPEPPGFPVVVEQPGGRKTLIVQVGHKGMYVGAVGVFKTPAGGLDLKYRLVQLGEEYKTKDGEAAAKANPVLGLLEEYAREVKARDFLAEGVKGAIPHPDQVRFPKLNLSYVGAARCQGCHPGESAKWASTKHSHAYEALEKAERPGLRQFDPECVVCHTVGYGFRTGYTAADKTPGLKHNGCENCHGPGSGHAANERNADLLRLTTPWRTDPSQKLPDVATMEKIAALGPAERGSVPLTPAQQFAVNKVSAMCMRCHDGENDPHFDLFKYWPKVAHSGLAGK